MTKNERPEDQESQPQDAGGSPEQRKEWTAAALLSEFERQADQAEAAHAAAEEPDAKQAHADALGRADRVRRVLEEVLEEGSPVRAIMARINEKEESFRQIARTTTSEAERRRAEGILAGLRETRAFISDAMAGRKSFESRLPAKPEAPADATQAAQAEQREGEAPQEWLDQRRERRFATALSEVRANMAADGSGGEYLFRLMEAGSDEPELVARLKEILKPADFAAIRPRFASFDSLSRMAGQEITRPVFVVTDKAVYGKLERVFGLTEGTSHGLHVPEGMFPNSSS